MGKKFVEKVIGKRTTEEVPPEKVFGRRSVREGPPKRVAGEGLLEKVS